ncbi:MAG: bromoperoxidase, partial [Planctomycetota bacterium]
MHQNRKDLSRQVRQQAADIDASRPPIRHAHNNEEYSYRDTADAKTPPTLIAMYTKGLPHDPETGLALNPVDYKLFVAGIQSGNPVDFRLTPLGPAKTPANDQQPSQEQITPDSTAKQRQGVWQSDAAKNHPIDDGTAKGAFVRAWESASAGNVFDLEGPDAQSVTMPPAPTLCSDELLAEMVEVYAMALLRDANFRSFPLPKSCGQNVRRRTDRSRKPARLGRARDFDYATDLMVDLPWFAWSTADLQLTSEAERRRRTLADDGSNLFRGSTSGEQVGPYLSQFLLLGNNALGHSNNAPGRLPTDGYALYGSLGIDLRVRIATEARDYLTTWAPFVDVQNGADLRGAETYVDPNPDAGKDPSRGHRFITTPRDLATYVHYDALYEAYLNACVFLLSAGAPFDRGLPFMNADAFDKQQGFAHFGGPHILTLVCEVATRALKAVRYQKFNVHRRLRPEALGGLIDRYLNDPALATG